MGGGVRELGRGLVGCVATLCHTICYATKGHSLRIPKLCCAMLCYAVLCYAVLCYAMLCYAMLCNAMLCYATLTCAMLCYATLRCAMLCCAMKGHSLRIPKPCCAVLR
jgi:hypothetical protein